MTLIWREENLDAASRRAAEALIEEARRRHRRRQRLGAFLLAVVLLTAAITYLIERFQASTTSAVTAPISPSSPTTIDKAAFRGLGTLAFVSKGTLFVLDGTRGTVHRLVVRGESAADPVMSPDGRWVAYLESPSPDSTNGAATNSSPTLWLARSDGSDAHHVVGLSNPSIVSWSPTADLLAVTTSPNNDSGLPTPQTMTLATVTSAGFVHTLFSVTSSVNNYTALENATWSPNGQSLAVATAGFSVGAKSRLFSVDVRTGAQTTWFSIGAKSKFAGMDEIVAEPAGWWSGWGIGFWVFGNGMTHNNDQSPLMVIRSPGATPKEIGTTLSDGTTDAIAVGAPGEMAIVSSGGGRDIGESGTEVETCSASSNSCVPVPKAEIWNGATQPCTPPGTCYDTVPAGDIGSGVTIDPAWSPDGSTLAYVKSPISLQDSTPIPSWLNAHVLFLYDPTTRATTRLTDASGVSVPQWSRNGADLLYVSHDSLWLTSVRGSKPVRIAGPLFGGKSFADAYPSYYHQVPFDAQFSWWSPK